jgi:hypothetical protein
MINNKQIKNKSKVKLKKWIAKNKRGQKNESKYKINHIQNKQKMNFKKDKYEAKKD